MIEFSSNTALTKWFVWCCDHLPATVTRGYGDGKPKDGLRRSGAFYVTRGTTLCHLFWAMLWVPLIGVALCSLTIFLFVELHVQLYIDHRDQLGIAGAFIPEGFALAVVLGVAVVGFAIVGAGKVGFFKALWLYLKSMKSRVCPLVSFSSANDAAPQPPQQREPSTP